MLSERSSIRRRRSAGGRRPARVRRGPCRPAAATRRRDDGRRARAGRGRVRRITPRRPTGPGSPGHLGRGAPLYAPATPLGLPPDVLARMLEWDDRRRRPGRPPTRRAFERLARDPGRPQIELLGHELECAAAFLGAVRAARRSSSTSACSSGVRTRALGRLGSVPARFSRRRIQPSRARSGASENEREKESTSTSHGDIRYEAAGKETKSARQGALRLLRRVGFDPRRGPRVTASATRPNGAWSRRPGAAYETRAVSKSSALARSPAHRGCQCSEACTSCAGRSRRRRPAGRSVAWPTTSREEARRTRTEDGSTLRGRAGRRPGPSRCRRRA